MILASWAKAGLAGEWILIIIDTLILASLACTLKSKDFKKVFYFCLLPIFVLCIHFFISYLNPSYKIPNTKEWNNLNFKDSFSKEVNLGKSIMISEGIESVIYVSPKDPELALALFFDLKNRYYDKYPKSISSTSKILSECENLISVNPKTYLPTLSISHAGVVYRFIHFSSQLLIGVLFFTLVTSRKSIRKILIVLSINSGLLAFFGIWQKLNYVPSDDLLEIWGIWNTPEPRYYFSSFTYKNHWSAFALLAISSIIGVFINNWQRKGRDGILNLLTLLQFLSFIFLMISIPLSGSRSGSLLLGLTFVVSLFLVIKHFKLSKIKNWLLLSSGLITLLIILFVLTKKLHPETTREMMSNFKSQYENFTSGKKPLRFLLWEDLRMQISEKPVFGFGFDSYRAINPIYQSKEVRSERMKGLEAAHSKYTPLVAFGHSEWLQKISEFGFFGILLITPIIMATLIKFIKCKSLLLKILFTGCFMFLIYSIIDFPAQTPVCLMTFSILLGLTLKYSELGNRRNP